MPQSTTEHEKPEIFNIASLLTAAALVSPDAPAVVSRNGSDVRGRHLITFGELDEDSTLLASGFINLGLEPGTRVAVLTGPGPDFHMVIYALFKAGLVPVVVDPGMGVRRFMECLSEGKPEALLGIPKAQLLSLLFPNYFKTMKKRITLGRSWGWGRATVSKLLNNPGTAHHPVETRATDTAAILFTSGATGPAKGVVYTHKMFGAQVELIGNNFDLVPLEKNLITFPLFGLFTPALRLTGVIPEMDPVRPGAADPKKIMTTILEENVKSLFASPALLKRLALHAKSNKLRIKGVKTIICAGAPVLPQLAADVKEVLEEGASLYTPYGASEAMPLTKIEAREIAEARGMSEQGFGMCVGKPVPGTEVMVMALTDKPMKKLKEEDLLPQGEIGEFIARGPVVAESYFELPEETAATMVPGPDGTPWRRMGDTGWKDVSGRLWFCGRKSQRVVTKTSTLFTISCEATFNNHPLVSRSALVGVKVGADVTPVIIVEPARKLPPARWTALTEELTAMAKANPRTRGITTFLMKMDFPMDIRHNAKIGREKLAVWAEKELAKAAPA
ncbi:MAG: AMP-binding protein [Deltaproteobacteria bacterium]|jgi:acyl-CoA synthetase (AMP-forming)/AMP-acid ligase II|nr:AMP-binding protein [Deltaproteobacteria bacterium]